jgi:hypothetical protein
MPAKTKAKQGNKPSRIEVKLTLAELEHILDLVQGYQDGCSRCESITKLLIRARNNPVATPK